VQYAVAAVLHAPCGTGPDCSEYARSAALVLCARLQGYDGACGKTKTQTGSVNVRSAICCPSSEIAVTGRKPDDARVWFNKARAIRTILAAAAPGNAGWQRDLCTTLAGMAAVATTPDDATRYRREARVLYEQLQRGGSFRGDHKFAQLGAELDQAAAHAGTRTTR